MVTLFRISFGKLVRTRLGPLDTCIIHINSKKGLHYLRENGLRRHYLLSNYIPEQCFLRSKIKYPLYSYLMISNSILIVGLHVLFNGILQMQKSHDIQQDTKTSHHILISYAPSFLFIIIYNLSPEDGSAYAFLYLTLQVTVYQDHLFFF